MDRTSMPPDVICEYMEFCLRSTYFQVEDGFFEQLEGAAMGSPLSPIVANLFMESFEKRALQTAEVRPRVWLRYVDDIFAVWSGSEQQLRRFHEHLNHQHPNIQFTTEEESNGKIAFLDVQVERYGNNVRSSVFRKSHHHPRILTGIIRCLKH